MEFVEASAFTRNLPAYLDEDEYRALQRVLAANPESGDVIPETGGFRKLRWGHSARGKGKRGGLRVIYYHFVADSQIWFLTIYGKNEADDLTPTERRALKAAITSELRQRK